MVKPHDTWTVIDSTKLRCFMTCPRLYLYEYIFGWQPTEPDVHLVFGIAWHLAMEHLLLHGYGANSVAEAYQLFLARYREDFSDPDLDEVRAPKTPEIAFGTLVEYSAYYGRDNFEVLDTEIAGSVPIQVGHDGERRVHFRVDAIVKDKLGVWVMDHKTAGKIDKRWRNSWATNCQVGTYTHAVNSMYGGDPIVKGFLVNGVEIKRATKKQQAEGREIGGEFERLPIMKQPDMMQVWLWETNQLVDSLEFETEILLEECSKSDQILKAFPRNTESCTKYSGCPFVDYCAGWPNPLRKAKSPPPGLKVDYWDPREQWKTAKRVVKL